MVALGWEPQKSRGEGQDGGWRFGLPGSRLEHELGFGSQGYEDPMGRMSVKIRLRSWLGKRREGPPAHAEYVLAGE